MTRIAEVCLLDRADRVVSTRELAASGEASLREAMAAYAVASGYAGIHGGVAECPPSFPVTGGGLSLWFSDGFRLAFAGWGRVLKNG